MKHLTITGQDAGKTLCGEPKTEPGIHATYYHGDFSDICPDCKRIWLAEDECDCEFPVLLSGGCPHEA
jgi:hypothetical protein